MKKLALTSLLAMFAVSGAHAANVMYGNPLYLPSAGHFYSVTTAGTHTEGETPWGISEEFGYGITDRFAVQLSTSATENSNFDYMSWDDFGLDLAYRVIDDGGWKLDIVGAYTVDPVWGDHRPFLKQEDTSYTWTAGVRGGYVGDGWTIAGHAAFNYWNTKSFNWSESAGEQGVHSLVLGLDGQFVIDQNWNLIAGVEYSGILDDEYRGVPEIKVKNAGSWDGYFGVNYNFDATKYIGAYVAGSMNHLGGDEHDEWKFDHGFGYGIQFGIDF